MINDSILALIYTGQIGVIWWLGHDVSVRKRLRFLGNSGFLLCAKVGFNGDGIEGGIPNPEAHS
jgi:hypothetical protein